jgi:hypothetical protein
MKDLKHIVLGLVFYFWRIFASWQQKNKVIATHPKPLFGGKKTCSKSSHYEEKNLKSPDLDKRFQHVAKT